jgi:hypothetical protein
MTSEVMIYRMRRVILGTIGCQREAFNACAWNRHRNIVHKGGAA